MFPARSARARSSRAGRRHSWARLSFSVFGAIAVVFGAAGEAVAQTRPVEEVAAETRAELERIKAQFPELKDQAERLLKGPLDPKETEPGTTRSGRSALMARDDGRRIVNGIATIGHPAVGAILGGHATPAGDFTCSATLVGCNQVLTAAHCVCDVDSNATQCKIEADAAARKAEVYFQDGGRYRIKTIQVTSNYRFPQADLALLTLDREVTGIVPMEVSGNSRSAAKQPGVISGFGLTGGNRKDYGIKRDGSIITEGCPTGSPDGMFCWRFNAEMLPARELKGFNTCKGDSGGGVFFRERVGVRTRYRIFGVVSGGDDKSKCVTNDLAANTDLSRYMPVLASWNVKEGAARSCMPQGQVMCSIEVGAPGRPGSFRFDDANPGSVTVIRLPKSATRARIAMNVGSDQGSSDVARDQVKLVVHGGRYSDEKGALVKPAPPQICTNDISGNGTRFNKFQVCEFEPKAADGVHHLELRRIKGAADVQLSVNFFQPAGTPCDQ